LAWPSSYPDPFSRRESLIQGIHPTNNMRIHRLLLLIPVLLAACNRGGAPAAGGPGAQGRGGAPPAAGVTMATLKETPIELSSDFISTVRSLNSTTIQPQVDGRVTKIYVKSGDQVRVGTPLVQIDPEKQAATVRSTESQRAGREADVVYWKAQVERLQVLLKAGAISQNEFDAAQHSLVNAEANLAALDAQVREGRVELQYYRVAAPTTGVVGDIAVREGDRITTSTVITTIDEKKGLEAYIQVPVDRAPDLKVGLPTQILDVDGKVVAVNPITFVSPRADPATQTVLAKSLLRQTPANMKIQQFVKIRVIWRSVPGLTVPITAVTRVNGQYFVYVAEAAGNGLVARQHPVQIGEVLGNDYVVLGGVKAGDRLIVGGIQKIGDGAPVRPE
jgi:RND family efflux transporter MFP subunit